MRLASVNVDVTRLHSAMWPMVMDLDFFWRNEVGYELIITHGIDGEHSVRSRHYIGCAIDIRTWTSPDSRRQMSGTRREALLAQVQRRLGENFRVLDLEYNGAKTHFHIQMEKLT